eukprot:2794083-Amphidinium_carterae.2
MAPSAKADMRYRAQASQCALCYTTWLEPTDLLRRVCARHNNLAHTFANLANSTWIIIHGVIYGAWLLARTSIDCYILRGCITGAASILTWPMGMRRYIEQLAV